jgi:hypothetical protein
MMEQTVTKDSIPDHAPCEVPLPEGWKAIVNVKPDEGMGPPWKEHDGHGPVREAGTLRDILSDKRPGEKVLMTYHRDVVGFYDFAEAVKMAKRDGWGAPEGWTCTNGGRKHSCGKGCVAVAAAEADYRRMLGWCKGSQAGGWDWCGVVVTVLDAEGAVVDHQSLWGIEDDTDYWREVAAELINDIAGGKVLPS